MLASKINQIISFCYYGVLNLLFKDFLQSASTLVHIVIINFICNMNKNKMAHMNIPCK